MGNEDIFFILKSSTEILKHFDKDLDGRLSLEEFGALCKDLFRKGSTPYNLEKETIVKLFDIFDSNSDGFICKVEFETCYVEWIRKIVNPVSVLVVVDIQNDFVAGSLALKNGPAKQEGKDVIKPVNEMQENIPFRYVFYTKDWHPPNHISFIENVEKWDLHDSSPIKDPKQAKVFDTVVFEGTRGSPVEQTLWPTHCIAGTWGAELDLDLKIVENSRDVHKGIEPGIDSYSAFLTTDKKSMTLLKACIDNVGAQDVYVCGLAWDYCVGGTAIDALDLGYRTIAVEDATRMIDLKSGERMRERLIAKNGVMVNTDQVKDMVLGIDRRPELGLHLALGLNKQFTASKGRKDQFPF